MQSTKTETGRSFLIPLNVHPFFLQIDIADNVVPHLSDLQACMAVLAAWASTTSRLSIQQLRLASRTGSSLVSVEAYAQVGDSIEQMLFVLIIDQGEWDYCSPAQIPFHNVRRVATTLITAMSPYLLGQQLQGDSASMPLLPSLG